MDADLALVIGLVVFGFSIPLIAGAISDGRAPRAAMVGLVVGGGLVLWALQQKPSGYRLDEIPGVFITVLARVIS